MPSGLGMHPSYSLATYQDEGRVPAAFPPPASQVPCALVSTRRKIPAGLSVTAGREAGQQGTLRHSHPGLAGLKLWSAYFL